MSDVRVRFAPSPTGYLHIGGVRTALFNWLWARKTGGKFILRIEDTDQARSTPESTQVILDSLRWLGIDWDEGPEVGGDFGPYAQMERLALYTEYAERLIAAGKAYRCTCTKETLDAQREALKAKDPKAQFKYPGACRGQKDVPPGTPHVIRFVAPTEGEVVYHDKVFGEIRTPNKESQDFVLIRTDGVPLYNFGAVVDDLTMKITLVARGRDHMINTPPQILLYEALGAPVPEFAHLPMMLNQKGAKLAKRDGAVGVSEYQNAGFTPMGLIGYLVRFGWSHGDQEIFSKEELIAAFSWDGCSRSDGRFDPKKSLALNHAQLKDPRLCPDDDYAARLVPFLAARGITTTEAAVLPLLPLVRERGQTFVEAAEKLDTFLRDEVLWDDAAVQKAFGPTTADLLENLQKSLVGAPFEEHALGKHFEEFLAAAGLTIKDVGMPVRVALTGKAASPGLLHQVMAALGAAKTASRLAEAATKARAQTAS